MANVQPVMESDEALARAAGQGDATAFRALMEAHWDRTWRVALGVLRNEADADDLTQEVWTAMPRKLRSWRGESRFTTWLHSVTLNAGRDWLRRAATRARTAEGYAEVVELRRGADADTEARLAWLRTALEALGEDLRETAALVLGDGMTQGQAAAALGVAEGTVAWRMSEIKRRLKALLHSGEGPA